MNRATKVITSVRTPLGYLIGLLVFIWFLSAGGGVTIKSIFSGRTLVFIVVAVSVFYIFPLVAEKGVFGATERIVGGLFLTFLFVMFILDFLPGYLNSLDATDLENVAQEAMSEIDTSPYDSMSADVTGLADTFTKDTSTTATPPKNPADMYLTAETTLVAPPVTADGEEVVLPPNVGGGAPSTVGTETVVTPPTEPLLIPHEAEINAIKDAIDATDTSALLVSTEALRAADSDHPLLDAASNLLETAEQRKATLVSLGMPTSLGEMLNMPTSTIVSTKNAMQGLTLQVKVISDSSWLYTCDDPVTLEVVDGWLATHQFVVGRCVLTSIVGTLDSKNIKLGYTFTTPENN